MKDKGFLGFVVIEAVLAALMIWCFAYRSTALGCGILGYFIINTLLILLKLFGGKKDQDGENK